MREKLTKIVVAIGIACAVALIVLSLPGNARAENMRAEIDKDNYIRLTDEPCTNPIIVQWFGFNDLTRVLPLFRAGEVAFEKRRAALCWRDSTEPLGFKIIVDDGGNIDTVPSAIFQPEAI